MSRYWSAGLLPTPLNAHPAFKQLEVALDQLFADANAYTDRVLAGLGVAKMTAYLLTDGSVQFLTATDAVPSGAIAGVAIDTGSVLVMAPAPSSASPLLIAESSAGALVFT